MLASRPRRRTAVVRASLAATALAVVSGACLTGCALGTGASSDAFTDVPAAQTVSYTGSVARITVPSGVGSVTITARGGAGGDVMPQDDDTYGAGAVVTGTATVVPGQTLLVSVGGVGQNGGYGSANPGGGWGGLGMHGGAGKGEKDHPRTSAAGGGATTVQLSDGSSDDLLLVAAGGGGDGGPSGDELGWGKGGDAGSGWKGADGGKGSVALGGAGGTAGAQPGGAGGVAGAGSGLGGNGGGGGGGVQGGDGGGGASGTSAGGGGGSGTSATYGLRDIAISAVDTETASPSNGTVTLTWSAGS